MSELTNAVRRDGTVLTIGDRVVTDFPGCQDRVFVTFRITPWATCESGRMVLVHDEHDALRIVDGHQGLGLDTNWFTHAHTPTTEHGPELHPRPSDGDALAGRAEPPADQPAAVPGDGERQGGRGVGRRADQQLGLQF